MKKLVALVAALAFIGSAYAQNQALPDGSFENWKTGKTFTGQTYDDLANPFWQTLNVLSGLPPEMGTGPIVVTKEEGRTGFCPKMESNQLTLGEKTIFLPGVVGALTVNIDNQTAYFGRPFTSRPVSVTGYMKYFPVNNDSAAIFAEVYSYSKSEEGEWSRKRIGTIEQIYHDTISEWAKFDLPIKYNSEETPDSLSFLFVSSAGYRFDSLFECKGQIGSTLWVDDCNVVYEDGSTGADTTFNEKHLGQIESKVYPNPAENELTVLVAETFNGKLSIFDPAGRLVKSIAVKGGENVVDITRLKAGLYTYRLVGDGKVGNGKFIKR